MDRLTFAEGARDAHVLINAEEYGRLARWAILRRAVNFERDSVPNEPLDSERPVRAHPMKPVAGKEIERFDVDNFDRREHLVASFVAAFYLVYRAGHLPRNRSKI